MNNEVTNILSRLETFKDSHPNIYKLWREYIQKKSNNLKLTITACNNTLNLINSDNINDLDLDTVATLFLLMNIDDLNEY